MPSTLSWSFLRNVNASTIVIASGSVVVGT